MIIDEFVAAVMQGVWVVDESDIPSVKSCVRDLYRKGFSLQDAVAYIVFWKRFLQT